LIGSGLSTVEHALSVWLPYRRPRNKPTIRLFCFAHAGGSAAIFREWNNLLPPHIEVCAIQLPGREARSGEPLRRRMDSIVSELAFVLRPLLDRPFALFGHSLGAKVAFEAARLLCAEHFHPAHIFVSGSPAPHIDSRTIPLHSLPDSELLEQLRILGGMPADLLNTRELLTWFLPVIRADLEVNETYVFTPGAALSSPMTAFGGAMDSEVPINALEAWREYTSGPFRRRILKGGHFFILEEQSVVTKEIRQDLELLCNGDRI